MLSRVQVTRMRESAGGEGRYVSAQESCRWHSPECFAQMWQRLGSVSTRCPAHSLAVEAEHGCGTAVITCHSGAGSQHPEPGRPELLGQPASLERVHPHITWQMDFLVSLSSRASPLRGLELWLSLRGFHCLCLF